MNALNLIISRHLPVTGRCLFNPSKESLNISTGRRSALGGHRAFTSMRCFANSLPMRQSQADGILRNSTSWTRHSSLPQTELQLFSHIFRLFFSRLTVVRASTNFVLHSSLFYLPSLPLNLRRESPYGLAARRLLVSGRRAYMSMRCLGNRSAMPTRL